MKNFKKIVVSTLVLVLAFSNAPISSVKASTNEKIENIASDLLNAALDEPDMYGLVGTSDEYQLSNAITPFVYNESGLLEEMDDTKYYFLYSNYKPIAALVSSDDSSSVLFETDTAKELNSFDSSCFTVICDENGTHIQSTVYDVNPQLTDLSLDNNTLDREPSRATFASSFPSGYGISVPFILQNGENVCWAASTASAGECLTGLHKTARQVCDIEGRDYIHGGNCGHIVDALAKCYGLNSSYIVNGCITITDIYNCLSTRRIPIAQFFANYWDNNTKNDLGHTVVIRGFSLSTQGAFLSIMDPNYSNYCMVFNGNNPSGYETWTLSYGSNKFYWEATVIAQ